MNYLSNIYVVMNYLKKCSGCFLVELSFGNDGSDKEDEITLIFYHEDYGDPISIKLRNDMLTKIHPDDILIELSHILDKTSLYYHVGNTTIN